MHPDARERRLRTNLIWAASVATLSTSLAIPAYGTRTAPTSATWSPSRASAPISGRCRTSRASMAAPAPRVLLASAGRPTTWRGSSSAGDVTRQHFTFPFFEELSPTVFQLDPPGSPPYGADDFAIMEYSGSGDVLAAVWLRCSGHSDPVRREASTSTAAAKQATSPASRPKQRSRSCSAAPAFRGEGEQRAGGGLRRRSSFSTRVSPVVRKCSTARSAGRHGHPGHWHHLRARRGAV